MGNAVRSTAGDRRAAIFSEDLGIDEHLRGNARLRPPSRPKLRIDELVHAPATPVGLGHDATDTAPRAAVDAHIEDDATDVFSPELVRQIDEGELVPSINNLDEVFHWRTLPWAS
jgi:hypothetical protein